MRALFTIASNGDICIQNELAKMNSNSCLGVYLGNAKSGFFKSCHVVLFSLYDSQDKNLRNKIFSLHRFEFPAFSQKDNMAGI